MFIHRLLKSQKTFEFENIMHGKLVHQLIRWSNSARCQSHPQSFLWNQNKRFRVWNLIAKHTDNLLSNQPHHWIGLAGQREQRAVCLQKWATPSFSSLSICLAPGHLPGNSSHTWNWHQLEIPGNTRTIVRICFVTIVTSQTCEIFQSAIFNN